jgi:hypothetical protein
MIAGRAILACHIAARDFARRRPIILFALAALAVSAALEWSERSRRWRIWKPGEVATAFWAWHNATPGEEDLRQAIETAKARSLFLRAGQIHYEGGRLRRVRQVTGALPKNIDCHLVYNATRECLQEFDRVAARDFAAVICAAFTEDLGRAQRDAAQITGLQLDVDVPTRLLLKYEQVLKETRARLPEGIMLSITGLPTWMESPALKAALSAVDFWIPQYSRLLMGCCYEDEEAFD